MESRRLQAVAMFSEGIKSQSAIARELGASRMSVIRWLGIWRSGGSMASRKATGRPRRRRPEHEELLRKIYAIPREYGRQKWSCASLSKVFRDVTGIEYHGDHMGKILIDLGLRSRKKQAKKSKFTTPTVRGSGREREGIECPN